MNYISIKYISIFTVIILSCYILASVFIAPVVVLQAQAAAMENEDIYKGIGIAILLYLLANSLQEDEDKEIEVREPVEDDSNTKETVADESYYRQEDIDLLARIIYAESRGEPYSGQIAVGAVVLNRVEHQEFPDTLDSVIYQDGQFTSVENGQINLLPGVTAYNAANDALAGVDPSNGALYFYNPKKAKTLWWLSTREKTAVIGDHVFAK